MTLTTEELDEMSPRQLGHLNQNAGDTLERDESTTEEMKSLGDISAEAGRELPLSQG